RAARWCRCRERTTRAHAQQAGVGADDDDGADLIQQLHPLHLAAVVADTLRVRCGLRRCDARPGHRDPARTRVRPPGPGTEAELGLSHRGRILPQPGRGLHRTVAASDGGSGAVDSAAGHRDLDFPAGADADHPACSRRGFGGVPVRVRPRRRLSSGSHRTADLRFSDSELRWRVARFHGGPGLGGGQTARQPCRLPSRLDLMSPARFRQRPSARCRLPHPGHIRLRAVAGFRPPRLVMRAKMTTDSSSPRGSEYSVRVTPEDLQTALARALAQAAAGLAAPGAAEAPVEVVPPRRPELGDWSTTVALRAAARPSRRLDLAEHICAHLRSLPEVASADIAGPGFVNITLTPAARAQAALDIITAADAVSGPTLRSGSLGDAGSLPVGRVVADTGQVVASVDAFAVRPLQLGHAAVCREERRAHAAGITTEQVDGSSLAHPTEVR